LAEVVNIRDTSYIESVKWSSETSCDILTAANKNFICSILVS
jgi:hypothetical protein